MVENDKRQQVFLSTVGPEALHENIKQSAVKVQKNWGNCLNLTTVVGSIPRQKKHTN